MSGEHRRFDAPRARTAGTSPLAFVVAHWGVALALGWTTAVLLAVALGLVVVDVVDNRGVADAVRSLAIAAQVDPQASSDDAQVAGAKLTALPDVGSAVLRSKDDGLKALIAAGLPAPDGRNPLPDLWILRIRPEAVLATPRSVIDVVGGMRRAAQAVAQVAAVRVDDQAVAAVDARVARWRSFAVLRWWLGLGSAALVLASVAFLAGRAVAPSAASLESRMLSLTLFAMAVITIAAIVVSIATLWGAAAVNVAPDSTLQQVVMGTVVERAGACVAIVLAIWIVTILGLMAGAERATIDS